MKNVKGRVRNILREINVEQESLEYIAHIVDYCIKKGIHILDINLQGELYPLLARKHKVAPCTVKHRLLRALTKSYNETDNLKYYETLNYTTKVSPKKMVILLVNRLRNEEK